MFILKQHGDNMLKQKVWFKDKQLNITIELNIFHDAKVAFEKCTKFEKDSLLENVIGQASKPLI
jgi:hypothetical protein